jgi:hypothetical protein
VDTRSKTAVNAVWWTLGRVFPLLNPYRAELVILTTHAIVGGAIASLFPSHPLPVVAACFASHFVIDAIPHWDYPLRSIAFGLQARNQWTWNSNRLCDFAVIALDGAAGLALAIDLFSVPSTILTIALGALAAMLPDPLQFVHTLYPREPLKSLQRFHAWMHTKYKIGASLGISSQIAFAAIVAGASKLLQ